MKRPQVLVLAGYGINCEYETAHAFNLPSVGGEATCVHVGDLIAQPQQLERFHILVIPGGFAFGDDIAAGIVLPTKLRYRQDNPGSDVITKRKPAGNDQDVKTFELLRLGDEVAHVYARRFAPDGWQVEGVRCLVFAIDAISS